MENLTIYDGIAMGLAVGTLVYVAFLDWKLTKRDVEIHARIDHSERRVKTHNRTSRQFKWHKGTRPGQRRAYKKRV